MARRLILLWMLILLWQAPAMADVNGFKGNDWIAMSQEEKFNCVLASIIVMDEHAVPLQRSPTTYIRMLDAALAGEGRLRDQDIAVVLAALVYHFEPASRPALMGLFLK